MRLGIAIPRATSITASWTTIHLARAALARGHRVRFIEPWDFEVESRGKLVGRAFAFDHDGLSADRMVRMLHHRSADRRFIDLEQLDMLLLRVAPLSLGVLTFARLLRDRGVPVINDPDGAIAVSHKAWLAALTGLPTPLTLVTRSRAAAHVFAEQARNGVVVKPARGSGGRGVNRVKPRDYRSLDRSFDDAHHRGDGFVVLQEYLAEARFGEKRLLWLDGELIGGYLRRRAPGEFRHNLSQGGTVEALTITDANRNMAAHLTAPLLAAGIRLAGLDVIGNHLTEVNVLNPGGTFHAERVSGLTLADSVIARFEEHPRFAGEDHELAASPDQEAGPRPGAAG